LRPEIQIGWLNGYSESFRSDYIFMIAEMLPRPKIDPGDSR